MTRRKLSAIPSSTVQLRIGFVNGDALDLEKPWSFVGDVEAMRARGVEDWRIVHELISDDWGPPPLNIEVTGTWPDGKPLLLKLHYRRPRR